MKAQQIVIITCFFLLAFFANGDAQDRLIVDAEYHPPFGTSQNVAVMFLGGSDGGMPRSDVEPFTAKGYPCFKVGYFGTEHTPSRLEMIPLEYFEKALEVFRIQPGVADKKIIVFGGSKGGELALLLASRYQQIQGVIASVPSSVVFQGIGGPLKTSSWSYEGHPVPFVPYYKSFDYSQVVNNQWLDLYRLSLTQTEKVEEATIRVEDINGPVLIFSGKADVMWPSSRMGEMIVERLKQKNFSHSYEHIAYENAGHSLNENGFISGTENGNRKARLDSRRKTFEFLQRLSEN
jgi:dienelactone hydrolase